MNTPTPETDSQAKSADRCGDDDVVRVGFARKLEQERDALRAALEALTVRFAKVESLYFDLAIKVGTTVAPECEAGELTRARALIEPLLDEVGFKEAEAIGYKAGSYERIAFINGWRAARRQATEAQSLARVG